MSKLEDQVIVAPGIPQTDSPALTLVEIIMKNNPVLLCHQLIQTTNKFYSLKTSPLELDSIENKDISESLFCAAEEKASFLCSFS